MELNDPRQGNLYDKVFKENMDANLDGIVAQVLSMKITRSEEISDDLQQTKERKADLLKKVQDENGQVFILHIEYQRQNDQNMAYRMAEYCIMLQVKHTYAY
ncbi:Rpn family recombination-promoting nuclease/putative transposase [Pedobacter sp. PLR]|uniref:Rpn family recombination-promoting nuclease/putative transposase n=1 Tax=Pedobacter sp. PLR TaxID=2994465 RepID=UPI0022468D42|nr:Rpn family recombination-promoting nuclease/putative transposase [Pedobacter sp. PLR]MCX2453392.1 Rpn family recombination-promoting nuclease/putative transposase [Pedobacter sp. PLR]